ncbi:MAG: M1 family aminopeptidase, partial [Bacteroidota bacterium]
CLLMITAFMNSAAARDYTEKTNQILFTTSVREKEFLLGRFSGALLISIIPYLGITLGSVIGSFMPWIEPERIGPNSWSAHFNGLMVFVIPNLLFAGSIIFSIAALTRNTLMSFIGSIALLVGYLISQTMIRDIENEFLGAILDPFGLRTFSVVTKYWTVDDRNNLTIGFEGLLLLNRLVWMGIGALIFAFTLSRFKFSENARPGKKSNTDEPNFNIRHLGPIKAIKPEFGLAWSFKQLFSQVRIESISIMKNVAFLVIMLFGVVNLIASMGFATSQGYGLTAFPVTYNMVDIIQGNLYLYIVVVITFYTGAIVWKEREAKVHDIYDALPYQDWIPMVSKTLAMFSTVLVLQITGIFIAITTQLLNGFTDLRIDVYVIKLLVSDSFTFLGLITLSIFIHSLVNNRYLGYFLFVALLIVNSFVWPALDIQSNLIVYGGTPSMIYSDMNGFGPFLFAKLAFHSYWLFAGFILMGISLLFWVRGREQDIRIRTRIAFARWPKLKPSLILLMLTWFFCGSWLYYNTKIVNEYKTPDAFQKISSDYEKKYKKYENSPQPRIISVDFKIELYPEKRRVEMISTEWLKNKTTTEIDTLFYTLSPSYDSEIIIKNAKTTLMDTVHRFAIFKLNTPLLPGDSIMVVKKMYYEPKGIENEISVTSIVENGSFFNTEILPFLGYQPAYEISDKNDRKKYDLPVRQRMPLLSDDPSKRMNSYISNNSDWVQVRSVFGTSGDQIAIAPGSLIKQWKSNGRNYFEYVLDHKSLNFYSFMSARYQVKKKVHNGIQLEVYYDQRHAYNVDKMLLSMEKSIDYYSSNFGPYKHKQARIIEFPRYASFAQAFPGTMPYSESIGFIANLEDVEDIDMVTYIVAHEMAHQWWAHQVVGPEMQGSTLLSESLSQYSALMVMEKMYGKSQMHKFLRYEMDRYLSSRGTESDKECPLLEVENQGYLHYNKASVIMFHLKEIIGEQQVNNALKSLVDSFAYREPPYPNANDLVGRLEQQTPDSLRYLINDLFKIITLFDNRVLEANVKIVDQGYETTLKIQATKMYADSMGRETPANLDDWIEIAVLEEPAKGKRYGKPIESRRVRMRDKVATFTFVTKQKPWQAGIDPFYYLVDRIPDDNLKKVSEVAIRN